MNEGHYMQNRKECNWKEKCIVFHSWLKSLVFNSQSAPPVTSITQTDLNLSAKENNHMKRSPTVKKK
jgi:hypothetical protein